MNPTKNVYGTVVSVQAIRLESRSMWPINLIIWVFLANWKILIPLRCGCGRYLAIINLFDTSVCRVSLIFEYIVQYRLNAGNQSLYANWFSNQTFSVLRKYIISKRIRDMSVSRYCVHMVFWTLPRPKSTHFYFQPQWSVKLLLIHYKTVSILNVEQQLHAVYMAFQLSMPTRTHKWPANKSNLINTYNKSIMLPNTRSIIP